MSCKKVSTREDIDFDKHLIKVKVILDEASSNFIKLRRVKMFYEGENFENYSVEDSINSEMAEYMKLIELSKKQLACTHDDIEFDKYVGHDSHKDYYDTSCNECGLVFDHYDV